jgi:hypothetical protein
MSDFKKKFASVAKAWAVPAFVIGVFKALVIDIPQIFHQIPQRIFVTFLLAIIESFAVVFLSVVVGAPGGMLFGSPPGAPSGIRFDTGSWRRKHYITAFCVFIGLWILQAKVLNVRAYLSVVGFSLFLTGVIGFVLLGLVSVWRKMPR